VTGNFNNNKNLKNAETYHLRLWPSAIRVEKNLGFFKKNNSPGFFVFLKKTVFFSFFKKKQDFVLFSKKTEKSHSELFLFHHAISLFSELHNNNFLYLLWHSKLKVKKRPPSLFLQSVVGQFTSKWCIKLGKHAHSKQKNHSHTNSAASRHVYVHTLLVQHL